MLRHGTTLDRLAVLFHLVEDMRSVEMQRAAGSLAEAESTILILRATLSETNTKGRIALEDESLLEWTMAESCSKLLNLQQARMETIRAERWKLFEITRDEYRVSRIERDQMAQLVENAKQHAERVEGRRSQAADDDRYLSRRLWQQREAIRIRSG